MMWNYKKALYIVLGLFLLVSCQQNEPEQRGTLQLNLCLPTPENFRSSARRVIGDPGSTEHFELPKYAYIVVMKEVESVWSVWRTQEVILKEDSWETTRYYGLNPTRGDSIFKYTGTIQFLLNNDAPRGRVYAICSRKKLSFSTAITNISTMAQLEEWKFNTEPDSIQESLQDIYSTPYNLYRGGDYYCIFDCSAGNVFRVDLVMYHVASKVDIKWSVAENKRINKETPSSAVRLTYMDACHLFNGMAYCFKPMENVLAAKSTSEATRSIVRPENEGLWWEGRSYFYTIPYTVSGVTNYFPLQMVLKTNGSSGTGYKPTLNLKIDTSTPFVPWLRATFNLSEPLTDKEETKTIDN